MPFFSKNSNIKYFISPKHTTQDNALGSIILPIDDDEDDLELLKDALKMISEQHAIKQANNGVEGLRCLKSLQNKGELPCLIVLDVNMPKMDGKETFIALQADKTFSSIPVMIFSTSSSMLDKLFFERFNTAYFVKPVNFKALVEAASRMIRLCRPHQND